MENDSQSNSIQMDVENDSYNSDEELIMPILPVFGEPKEFIAGEIPDNANDYLR